MGCILAVDGVIILAFMIMTGILAIETAQALQGIVTAIATVIFIIEILFAVVIMIYKIICMKTYYDNYGLSFGSVLFHIWNLFMSIVSTWLCLYASYLFLQDLTGYGTSILDAIEFVISLIFVGFPWLLAVMGWIGANAYENGFNYFNFLLELAGTGVIYFIAFVL